MAVNPMTFGARAIIKGSVVDNADLTSTLPVAAGGIWVIDRVIAFYDAPPAANKLLTMSWAQAGVAGIMAIPIIAAAAAAPYKVFPVDLTFPDETFWVDAGASNTFLLTASGTPGVNGNIWVIYH